MSRRPMKPPQPSAPPPGFGKGAMKGGGAKGPGGAKGMKGHGGMKGMKDMKGWGGGPIRPTAWSPEPAWGPPQAAWAPPTAEAPPVTWLKLPPHAPMVSEGYPPQAPVVQYSGEVGWLLSSAKDILADILGDIEEGDINVEEDGDWTIFPEVGEAAKQAGCPETSMAVATCVSCGRWAVGMAGKLKHRSNCATLSLCIALTVDCDAQSLRSMASRWPDYVRLLQSANPSQRGFQQMQSLVPAWGAPEPWAPQQGGSKKSKKRNKPAAEPTEPTLNENGEPATTFTWITLSPDAKLVEEGYPEIAPAMAHDPGLTDLLSHSGKMLEDFVGEAISEDVTLSDDGDWSVFPEVGEALKAEGFEENSMCVAACVSQCRWAVGIGGKWKKRESAAKLALCVALAADHPEAERLATEWPDLFKFAEEYMLDPDNPKKRVSTAAPMEVTETVKAEDEGAEAFDPEEEPPAKKQKAPAWVDDGSALPRDSPFWIQLPDTEPTPTELEGLNGFALCVASDGKNRKGLYSSADEALGKFLEDPASEVQYFDDFDWKKFPAVGLAMKEVAEKEECFTLAVCPSRVLWAVGVGMKGKVRGQTSKVAMATALALQGEELAVELPDMEGLETFLEFVEEAKSVPRPDM